MRFPLPFGYPQTDIRSLAFMYAQTLCRRAIYEYTSGDEGTRKLALSPDYCCQTASSFEAMRRGVVCEIQSHTVIGHWHT
jgi:hypothetical protein